MPHSISPEAQPAEGSITDVELDIGAITTDTDNQQDCEDHEMTMENAIIEGNMTESPKTEVKKEVKLEDLFADIDSDEEFPSSDTLDIKTSSSPEAPASPV
jgi:DNA primase small subunit